MGAYLETLVENPPMRVEFEHAIVFASFGEAMSMRRGKSGWGELSHIEPLRPHDMLHPTRIVYQLKATNKLHQRWQFRHAFRRVLGRDGRLVTLAMQLKCSDFLERLTSDDVRTIERKLDLKPAAFWRAVRRGDKYGMDGIHAFMQRLEERIQSYRFDFPEATHDDRRTS